MTKLDYALAHARQGFRVFPLRPNDKRPAIAKWPERATTEKETIEHWWIENPDYNIGVATGKGLVVLDIDVKGKSNDFEWFDQVDAVLDLRSTYTVATPSGGLHAYFKTDQEIGNSASKIAPGDELRSP